MTWWAQNKNSKYQLPSETEYFAKLAFAIAMQEFDEEVINRQRAEWIEDLMAMKAAAAPADSAMDNAIQLPDGVQLQQLR